MTEQITFNSTEMESSLPPISTLETKEASSPTMVSTGLENSIPTFTYSTGTARTAETGGSLENFFDDEDTGTSGAPSSALRIYPSIYKRVNTEKSLQLKQEFSSIPDQKEWMTLDLKVKKNLSDDAAYRNIMFSTQNLPVIPGSAIYKKMAELATLIQMAWRDRLEEKTKSNGHSSTYNKRYKPYNARR